MEGVTPGVRAELGVRIWTRATIYVANEIMRVFLIILDQRGLSNSKLISQKEAINNGLYTWIATRYLNTVICEVYLPSDPNKPIERWGLSFIYEEPKPDEKIDNPENAAHNQFKTYIEQIYELTMKLDTLPEGTEYRIVVNLDPDAPAVEGWQPTTIRDISHLKEHHIGDEMVETGLISVGMEYRRRS